MSIHEKVQKLRDEERIIKRVYDVDTTPIEQALAAYDAVYNDANSTVDQLEAAHDVAEAAVEDVCLANQISEESLEDLMKVNFL